MKTLKTLLKIAPLLLCAYAGSANALVINMIPAAGMDTTALAGFQAAANRWTSVLSDNVTVNLNVNFTPLRQGVLGSTGSNQVAYYYRDFRNFLGADVTSRADAYAVSNLPTGPCMSIMMNGTTTNPNGAHSNQSFVDNNCDINNQAIRLTTANARALGLHAAQDNVIDGSISFTTLFTWDFDPTNGVDADAYDFIGVATHEIGHALGFISGVDILDQTFGLAVPDAAYTYVAPADLYRCSGESKAAGADIDWSADKRRKYFSLDNCDNAIAEFSTGRLKGDGQQNSHWKDNLGLGILDPTGDHGEELNISGLDLLLFDVIGWDVRAVPEPGSIALVLLGLAGIAGARRRAK